MKYISIIFLVFLLNSSTSMSKEVIPQETWKNINKVLSSPVSCTDTWIDIVKILEGKCEDDNSNRKAE
mgnify:FL=1|tara:strand:- start:2576 stop:2779 length:204 start_codon:yes stop_codon:yes gene_type:complete